MAAIAGSQATSRGMPALVQTRNRRVQKQVLAWSSGQPQASLRTAFLKALEVPACKNFTLGAHRSSASSVVVRAQEGAYIEFIRGLKEQTVPEVRLTRAKDGSSGTATFTFNQPSVFDQSSELGDITGLYLVDEEGTIQSMEVSARFVNGRPQLIEARHIMRSEREWDRFMRFMERYAESYGLGFTKST